MSESTDDALFSLLSKDEIQQSSIYLRISSRVLIKGAFIVDVKISARRVEMV